MKEELLKGLTEEQLEKIRACKSTEEMLEVAKEEGVELSEEQLEAITGGACEEAPASTPTPTQNGLRCPRCGSTSITIEHSSDENEYSRGISRRCNQCGNYF